MTTLKLHIEEDFYEQYLRMSFRVLRGKPVINLKNPLGGFIHSNIIVSPIPKESYGNNLIQLKTASMSHYNLDNAFLYFDKMATIRINKAIAYHFDLDFRQFCISGYEKGIKQDIIIKSFIRIMRFQGTDLYERLKKRDYRRKVFTNNLLADVLSINENNKQESVNQILEI